jgi:hypothetical protein
MWLCWIKGTHHASHSFIAVNTEMLELDLITAWHQYSSIILDYVI